MILYSNVKSLVD